MKLQVFHIVPVRYSGATRYLIKDPIANLYYQGHFWSSSKLGARGYRSIEKARSVAASLESALIIPHAQK